ncbi:MAG TPA: condensation domain-containing protein, partial [Thermoanaerobaculia bacterium]|nr:condensation domain-containing protein [Thermoanaerobaculia bacterium]
APEAGGGFSGWLEYNRDLFEAATVERLAAQLGRVLQAVAERPELKVSELPLLSPAERRRLLEEWSRTPGDYPVTGTAHGLFVEQALKTPDKAAVVGRSETLTFRHLDERSSRLAQLIKEMLE